MRQSSRKKAFAFILFLILFSLTMTTNGLSSEKQLFEAFGTVQVIEGKKISLQTDDSKELWIFVENPASLKTGDFVKIVYYSISDSGNIFAATEIEILNSN